MEIVTSVGDDWKANSPCPITTMGTVGAIATTTVTISSITVNIVTIIIALVAIITTMMPSLVP